MIRNILGEFKEVLLQSVSLLTLRAYNVAIAEDAERQTSKTITTEAARVVLQRIVSKSFIRSPMKGALFCSSKPIQTTKQDTI